MRLRAINIYSAFLGDLEKTKERTALIRKNQIFYILNITMWLDFVITNL